MIEDIEEHVKDHKLGGSFLACLGIRKMPAGYALMLNPDRTHFYWIRHDGEESSICCDKWAVYRGAKADLVGPQGK